MSYGVKDVVRDRAIVEALADLPAPLDGESGDCLLCDVAAYGDGVTAAPEGHLPECPWRRAREACT